MAATRTEGAALAALMQAALALPILVVPARAGAAEVGEVGVTVLGYKERGLMKITEPIVWGHARIGESWEIQASGAVDIITGASPQVVSNLSGKPVQTITGASISDRRTTSDFKVTRKFGELALGASRTLSNEEDYNSHAFGLDARLDLDQRNTTLAAGYGLSNDRVRSADNLALDERRDTREYLAGVTQVLSPLAAVQSTLTFSRGRGWYNDPYKFTLTFYPVGSPALAPDRRPSSRDSVAWLTRYRRHVPQAHATLQADYRFYRDDWGVRSHTLEVAWQRELDERWALRPALRYYTQSSADFYSPLIPQPQPEVLSSDQRLASFGGLSPSLRAIARLDGGLKLEATAGYVYNSRSLRLGGSGSEFFQTLRAYYAIIGISREF
ncbi:MAG: DUF3570 domain-containing protein [Usitatibacter sp.]